MKLFETIAGALNPLVRCARALESIDETLKRVYPKPQDPGQSRDPELLLTSDADLARWDEEETRRKDAGERSE